MCKLPAIFRSRRTLVRAAGVLLLVGVSAAVAIWRGWFAQHNPLLDSPRLALESLQAKSLYYNGRARPWLLSQRPDLLTPEDREADSERSRALPQAVQNA